MDAARSRPRSPVALVVLLVACALAGAGFAVLGVWQVQRLAWKQALIARVERHVHAAPVPVPDAAHWGALGREDEYLRVQASGRFEPQRQVLVAATTELGAGYWVLAPLQTQQGFWVLVNRGFVPPELRGKVPPPAVGPSTVTGLLRPSEPGGRLLQHNDPDAGRWYSRDVAAIAWKLQLPGEVAPYFIDAEAVPTQAGGWPRAGLTVIRFPNDHLAYALTWFTLAGLMAVALGYLLLDARRRRRLSQAHTVADSRS